jgi:hypothetical protein
MGSYTQYVVDHRLLLLRDCEPLYELACAWVD